MERFKEEWRRVFDRKRGIKTVIGRGDLVFGESREMLKGLFDRERDKDTVIEMGEDLLLYVSHGVSFYDRFRKWGGDR